MIVVLVVYRRRWWNIRGEIQSETNVAAIVITTLDDRIPRGCVVRLSVTQAGNNDVRHKSKGTMRQTRRRANNAPFHSSMRLQPPLRVARFVHMKFGPSLFASRGKQAANPAGTKGLGTSSVWQTLPSFQGVPYYPANFELFNEKT